MWEKFYNGMWFAYDKDEIVISQTYEKDRYKESVYLEHRHWYSRGSCSMMVYIKFVMPSYMTNSFQCELRDIIGKQIYQDFESVLDIMKDNYNEVIHVDIYNCLNELLKGGSYEQC